MKKCPKCEIDKPVSEFYTRHRKSKPYPSAHCKPCTREIAKAWYIANRAQAMAAAVVRNHKNRDARHDKHVQDTYGLEPGEYEQRDLAQGGLCAICQRPETSKHRNIVRRLAVDHSHVTGLVRGLLCAGCNRAIGYMQEDPERLRAAARYLEENS